MAKRVRTDPLLDTGGPHGVGNCLVDGTGVQMVTADNTCARVG
jgi:hypothetical protein